jgi:hypothetical protein
LGTSWTEEIPGSSTSKTKHLTGLIFDGQWHCQS